jgi:pseudouridine-5'-phosphate glycosidase
MANISVFSTGGIGGVHREVERTFDISQDLTTISKTPIIIVTAGAKSILDIPRTVEALETLGVTTLGYKTDVFPAFFYRDSGVFGPVLVNSSKEIVSVFKKNLELKISSATLVTNPIPRKDEIPKESIDLFIKEAYEQLPEYSISGKDVTPFLLKYIVERSGGKSLQANIALALNNVRVGIKIAKEIVRA